MANTIEDQIQRIENAKSDIYASIVNKGVFPPIGTKIDQLASYIDQITTGGEGGGAINVYEVLKSTGSVNIKKLNDITKIYCGSTVPSASTGADGDVYIRY